MPVTKTAPLTKEKIIDIVKQFSSKERDAFRYLSLYSHSDSFGAWEFGRMAGVDKPRECLEMFADKGLLTRLGREEYRISADVASVAERVIS